MHFFVEGAAASEGLSGKPAVRTAVALITRLVTEEAVVALDEDGEVVDVLLVTEEKSYDHAHVLEEMDVKLQ